MPKHKRIRAYLPNLLDGENMTTSEIMDQLEIKWPRTCPTIHSIGNILSGHKEIEQTGFRITETCYGDYKERSRNAVWSRRQD